MNLKDRYFYIEFEILSLDRFEYFQKMFEKLKIIKNDWMNICDSEKEESNLDYQDPIEDFNWYSYLDNEAKAWFEDTFDYDSEEGIVYQKLCNLTHYEHRLHPFLRTPGNWDLESMLHSIFCGEYCLIKLVRQENNREENNRGCLYYEPMGHPFGGSDSLVELIRAFGNRVIYDFYHENDNLKIESQWNYELAKELVKKGIGFTPDILNN